MLIRATEVSPAELSDYVRRYAADLLPRTSIAHFIKRQDIALEHSCLAVSGGQIIGAALLATREGHWNLNLLAVRTLYRSQGIAGRMLKQCFAEVGDQPLSLEVQSSNIRAQALYERHGFVASQKSLFWHHPLPMQLESDITVKELAPDIALNNTEMKGLPWPAQGATLLKSLPSLRGAVAFQEGEVAGISLFACRQTLTVYRLQGSTLVTAALLRFMIQKSPSSTSVFVPWVTLPIINDNLKQLGFRRLCTYTTYVRQK